MIEDTINRLPLVPEGLETRRLTHQDCEDILCFDRGMVIDNPAEFFSAAEAVAQAWIVTSAPAGHQVLRSNCYRKPPEGSYEYLFDCGVRSSKEVLT